MNQNKVTVTHYSEHTDDPKSWASPKPDFDLERFNRDLERRAGSIGSVPRFRCVWGAEEIKTSGRYMIEDFRTLEGYTYIENGVEKRVSAKDLDFEFPDGALVTPYFETSRVFMPRFVVEEYREPFYEKAWAIETIQVTGEEYGRVDIISHYREPSEIDMQMAEHLTYLRQHLTDDQIRDGLDALNRLEESRKANERAEMIDEIAEETAKALTDGLPNATKFGFNPNLTFDIKQYSKNLIKEHNSKI